MIANNVTNLGSVTGNLTFNPAVVHVTSVDAGTGNALKWAFFSNINNSAGFAIVTTGDQNGLSGDVIIANFTLNAVGSDGTSSPLNIAIDSFADAPRGHSITVTPVNGTFNITASEDGGGGNGFDIGAGGQISYSNNGTGISVATVNLTNTSGVIATIATNSSGGYNFTNVITGSYNVTASKPRFFSNSTSVVVTSGSTSTVNLILWMKGDLNNNGIPADAGDLVLMKRAAIGEIPADFKYDLNNNGILADAGDLVLMKRAAIGEIILS